MLVDSEPAQVNVKSKRGPKGAPSGTPCAAKLKTRRPRFLHCHSPVNGKAVVCKFFSNIVFQFHYLASIGVRMNALSLTDAIRIYAGGVRNHVSTVIPVKDLIQFYITVDS